MNIRSATARIVNRALAPLRIEIRHVASGGHAVAVPPPIVPYNEREAVGSVNLSEKLERVRNGGPFEWPDIVNLNRAVAKLVDGCSSIVELGAGTGALAVEIVKQPNVALVCSEMDAEASQWARDNRADPKVTYISRAPTAADGPFSVAIAVEVIEHVVDFGAFIRTCSGLAPRVILTTPNRARSPQAYNAGPPPYFQHVREWTAGEFYWVLRCFFRTVELYAMTSQTHPEFERINVNDERSALIADCRDAI